PCSGFFFSSRRRHTRFSRDWSSDVCSSDLTLLALPMLINMILPIAVFVAALVALNRLQTEQELVVCFAGGMSRWRLASPAIRLRSEERRVGKEARAREGA